MEGVTASEESAGADADLARAEMELIRKVEVLEAFLEQNPNARPTIQDRCRVLQRRIEVMEEGVSRAGRRDDIRRLFENYSQPNQQGQAHKPGSLVLTSRDGSESRPSSPSRPGSPEKQSQDDHRNSTAGRGSFPGAQGEEMPLDFGIRAHRPKRIRTAANERPPCLRCRILKKKCDSLEQCCHCPQKYYGNESDYWTALGCYRGPLTTLSEIFCPVYSRSTTRTLRRTPGHSEAINICTRERRFFGWQGHVAHLLESGLEFSELSDGLWETTESLKKWSARAHDVRNNHTMVTTNDEKLRDFKAPWCALYAVSADPSYLAQTEYNLFTLLRLGNKFSHDEPNVWSLFSSAKNLMVKAVETLLSERDISKSVAPYISVDVKSDMEIFLGQFESICTSRGKLSGSQQLACYYALLLFSVVKSLLIDAYSIQGEYEDHRGHWDEREVTRIISAYKALVSVFGWASKSDVMLSDDIEANSSQFRFAIQATRRMLHQAKWEERGIKGAKDFLLGLGSFTFPNDSYNGFFVQKFGLAQLKKLPSMIVDPDVATFDHGFHIGAPTAFFSGHDVMGDFGSATPEGSDILTFMPMHNITASPADPTESSNYPSSAVSNNAKPKDAATWKHTVFGKRGLLLISESPEAGEGTIHRRRKPFSNEERLKVKKVREKGACWRCRVQKLRCSADGDVCIQCLTRFSSRVGELECDRSNFIDYSEAFSPDILYSHLNKPFIEKYISEHIASFTDISLDIEVTWDGLCPRNLNVSQFTPSTWELIKENTQVTNGNLQVLGSAPVGILGLSEPDMKKLCRDSLDATLVDQSLSKRISGEESPKVWGKTLAILSRYFSFNKTPLLLRRALLLHLANYFMGRMLVFTEQSAFRVRQKLQGVDEQLACPYISSQLLDIQLKYILLKITRDLVTETLEGLEKTMRSATKKTWPASFATILLLCLSTEEIQVAAITSVGVEKIAGKEPPSKKAAIEACRALEDSALRLVTRVFHEIYRSSRKADGSVWGNGFNPLGQVFAGKGSDLDDDPPARDMIQEIGQMVSQSYAELYEKNQPPDFDAKPEEFAKKNPGRVVAKFLLSFVDEIVPKKFGKESTAASTDSQGDTT